MKFHSLTHARAVRERLAHIASGDPVIAASIESICRAEGDFRKTIKDVQHGCMMRWDGNGIPDWTYLDKLGDAVEYIRLRELSAVSGAWVCACVKRDKSGALSHIKLNSHKLSRCPVCGATQHAARNP